MRASSIESAAGRTASGGAKITLQRTQPLAIGAAQAAELFSVSLRTWWRQDSVGAIPRGYRIGGRKLWRASDLNLWAEWGFPERAEFERRLVVASSNGGQGDDR